MACCIIGCRTNYKPTKKYPNPAKHSCFYFPKDLEQRNLWIAAVSRENWTPNAQSRVCARHFLASDFRIDVVNIENKTINTLDGLRSSLLPHATPSINLTPEEVAEKGTSPLFHHGLKNLPDQLLLHSSFMKIVNKKIGMNSENQDEELEVLRSIYEGDGSFRELNPKSFQYKYGIEGEPHSFVLEISWPESYPESLPDINLDAFYNKHMKTHVKDNIKSKVLKEADANVGSAMTYTLIEWVKENLEELLIDQPSNLDTSISVANLDIEEKVEHLCKDNKERRTGLTKAQKRRQWDRMDGKGEKIRGYDWVDVIKHLSQTGGSAS